MQGRPNVWIVEKIQGSAPKLRVGMTGYVLAEACCNALADVVELMDTAGLKGRLSGR